MSLIIGKGDDFHINAIMSLFIFSLFLLISAIFLIFYGVFRIISEIYRLPDEQIGYIFGQVTIGMIISIPMIILGIIILNRKNGKKI